MFASIRPLLWWSATIFGVVVLCVLVAWNGGTFLIEFPGTLAVGWMAYLVRVIPQLKPDPWIVCTAVVCLLGVILGTHAFLKWLYSATSDEPRDWPRKWTLQLVGLVVLMFIAGIAFTGLIHQTSWLARSPEPLIRSSLEAGPRIVSRNNLKYLVVATHDHKDNTKPPELPRSQFAPSGQAMHSWQTALLPYLERGALYRQIDLKKPWTDPANAAPLGEPLRVFLHPALLPEPVNGYGVSHYAGNVHVVLSDTPRTLASFQAGTSNTILAGEVSSNFRAWGDPLNARDPTFGPGGFGGPNGKLAQFAMLDGSVRTLDPQELAELLAKPPE
jgi:hypothetical protein